MTVGSRKYEKQCIFKMNPETFENNNKGRGKTYNVSTGRTLVIKPPIEVGKPEMVLTTS